jgi:hypothetical protein
MSEAVHFLYTLYVKLSWRTFKHTEFSNREGKAMVLKALFAVLLCSSGA